LWGNSWTITASRMIDRVAGQLRDALAQFNGQGQSAALQAA
jgi:hypothetical protein